MNVLQRQNNKKGENVEVTTEKMGLLSEKRPELKLSKQQPEVSGLWTG